MLTTVMTAARALTVALVVALSAVPPAVAEAFANGFPAEPGVFPIGVWLQNTRHAGLYKAFGINTFVALWKGPTEVQLSQLAEHGLYAVAEQSPAAMALPHAGVIRAWMQIDEPDNAQRLAAGGYGDCVQPDELLRRYEALKTADPTRPVLMNCGQGVANPAWVGRGAVCSRMDHERYYSVASRAADIVSFDIYPAAEERQAHVQGRLDLVAVGVEKLRRWAAPDARVWAFIETTHIKSAERRPTAAEVRAEVWMAIVHGARGIVYFVHEWKPTFREDGMFRYPEVAAEVARTNALIAKLAPALNAGGPVEGVEAESAVRIATLARRHEGSVYIVAVNMERKAAVASLRVPGVSGEGVAMGEERIAHVEGGRLSDHFEPYGVHVYRLPGSSPR